MATSRTTVVLKDGWKDGALAIADTELAIANGTDPTKACADGNRSPDGRQSTPSRRGVHRRLPRAARDPRRSGCAPPPPRSRFGRSSGGASPVQSAGDGAADAAPGTRRDRGVRFLVPAIVILGLTSVYPTLYSIYMSFFDWNWGQRFDFVGLANYVEVCRPASASAGRCGPHHRCVHRRGRHRRAHARPRPWPWP